MATRVPAPLSIAQPGERVLFAGSRCGAEPCEVREQLSEHGYQLEIVGIEEALWLWPIEGFELLLIDATSQPLRAIELCRHVKRSPASPKVVLLFGDRTGAVPHRFDADAVLSGTPTREQLLAVLHLILAPSPYAENEPARRRRPQPVQRPEPQKHQRPAI